MIDFEHLRRDPHSRRLFLGRMTAAGFGAAAIGLFADDAHAKTRGRSKVKAGGRRKPKPGKPKGGTKAQDTSNPAAAFPGIPGRNANEIVLNFALTLEILEADLYRQALNYATGRPLNAPLAGNAAGYRLRVGAGGLSADNAADGFQYLVQFTYIEAAHRDFLAAAIQAGGGDPVDRNPGGYKFPQVPAADLKSILAALLPLEETGVRAYLGALPFMTDLNLAQTAAGIYSTECRHSAVVAYTLGINPGPRKMTGDLQVTPQQPSENTFEYYLEPATVINAVQPFFA